MARFGAAPRRAAIKKPFCPISPSGFSGKTPDVWMALFPLRGAFREDPGRI
ncbi:MAG: Hypothetical protein C75L2_00560019 [Leptospirillum sp. Group II 'C75']|nr:MAG: hypothetical protein UBAL2_85240255 [Leptospirillum rubarum]EIJ76944.1 MAG: Hypothetical protein C75L2_00560019 [Leptospirillum sp. Group II 'C75']